MANVLGLPRDPTTGALIVTGLIADSNRLGQLLPTYPGTIQAVAIPTAGLMSMLRFSSTATKTYKGISLSCSTAASIDDPVAAAVYDASGNLLASSGAVNGKVNAIGAPEIDFTVPLTIKAGVVVYIAFQYGTIGGTVARFGGVSWAGSLALLFGASVPNVEYQNQAAIAFPPPATITFAATAAGAATSPVMALLYA